MAYHMLFENLSFAGVPIVPDPVEIQEGDYVQRDGKLYILENGSYREVPDDEELVGV